MSEIDWGKPIEAVHEDGRVVALGQLRTREGNDQWPYIADSEDGRFYVHKGQARIAKHTYGDGWRIRNTPQQTPTSDVVGISEQTEVLSVLVEALSAMVHETTYSTITDDTLDEARGALLRARALLPEPVDGDLVEARHLAEEGPCNRVEVILAAIRRGRALERGDGA